MYLGWDTFFYHFVVCLTLSSCMTAECPYLGLGPLSPLARTAFHTPEAAWVSNGSRVKVDTMSQEWATFPKVSPPSTHMTPERSTMAE